jgi:phosphotransferase system  glucose/maltose/N-acetylglucosamine-specific IIC component
MSIDHTISMAIAPIGALLAGPMANLIGTNTLFIICASMGIIYPVLLWFFTKIRYLEHPREEDIEDVSKQEIIKLKVQDA